MNKNTRNGLLALLGAVVAYWKFGMKPEQKEKLKSDLSQKGKQLMDQGSQELNKARQTLNNRLNGKKEGVV